MCLCVCVYACECVKGVSFVVWVLSERVSAQGKGSPRGAKLSHGSTQPTGGADILPWGYVRVCLCVSEQLCEFPVCLKMLMWVNLPLCVSVYVCVFCLCLRTCLCLYLCGLWCVCVCLSVCVRLWVFLSASFICPPCVQKRAFDCVCAGLYDCEKAVYVCVCYSRNSEGTIQPSGHFNFAYCPLVVGLHDYITRIKKPPPPPHTHTKGKIIEMVHPQIVLEHSLTAYSKGAMGVGELQLKEMWPGGYIMWCRPLRSGCIIGT